VDNYFSTDYKKTIGSTFMVKRLKVKNVEVVLQIWDMAGDEYFRSMVPLLIKGASAIVLVYDLSRDATLANIPRWADLVVSSTRKTMPLVLIGNKQDLIRTKQFEQAQFLDNIQKKYKFSGIFQTSAKTSEGVEDTFKKLAENIVKWELKV
jgi:small GTP-binding protein